MLQEETFTWVEGSYIRKRRLSTLGYVTPTKHELGYRNIHDLAG
jgi:hypothetical protein